MAGRELVCGEGGALGTLLALAALALLRHSAAGVPRLHEAAPAFVGRAVAALAGDPAVSRWSGQALSSGQLARVYGFTDLDGSQPDAWRYVPEVQDAGKPADTTGYR